MGGFFGPKWFKFAKNWAQICAQLRKPGRFLRKIAFGPILRAPLMPYFSPYLQLAWTLGRLFWPRTGQKEQHGTIPHIHYVNVLLLMFVHLVVCYLMEVGFLLAPPPWAPPKHAQGNWPIALGVTHRKLFSAFPR